MSPRVLASLGVLVFGSASLSGGVVTGTVTYSATGQSSFPGGGSAADSASMSYSVTPR